MGVKYPLYNIACVSHSLFTFPVDLQQGDQRALEHEIWSTHGVRSEFATIDELCRRLSVNGEDKNRLFYLKEDGTSIEISVAYYRACYTPNDYKCPADWETRRIIETSAAIKCPSAGYHLAGTKAIQAALCKPGVLERFLTHEECSLLRQCFAAQFSLGDVTRRESSSVAIANAISDGSNWVFKPQREGGGNNYYGAEVSNFLKSHLGSEILDGYVLMQRIFPNALPSTFYKQGILQTGLSISELGVYGIYLGSRTATDSSTTPIPTSSSTSEVTVRNSYGGYLLRTKQEGVDEGGVATGYSVLNSIYLY